MAVHCECHASVHFRRPMTALDWWTERKGDLRFLPTRRLAAAIAIASPLWLLAFLPGGRIAGLFAAAVLVVAAVVDGLALPSRRDVVVDRELPPTIGVGDVANGEIRVTAHWRAPLAVRVFDQLPPALEQVVGHDPRVRTVPREGVLSFPFQVRGRARGRWPLGPVVVRVVGPLGLVQRSLEYPHRATVDAEVLAGRALGDWAIVAPSIAGIRHFRLLALQQRLRDSGVRVLRKRGEGLSFAGLREYAVGDDPRRIDWKATARRQKTIAREYTIEQGQTVMIAIDAGRLMTQLAGDLARFEHALSSALILADVALGSGDRVGVLVFDDEIRGWVPPGKGRATLQRIRDALVPAQSSMAEPDYALAFRTLAMRHRKRSLIVVFTDAIDVRASQSLIAHTSRSAARHLPVVVALRNDELAGIAVPPARAPTSIVFESAAAEELMTARDEALWRMRRAGVTVLDVSPSAMTAAVINRYLELKGRAAL